MPSEEILENIRVHGKKYIVYGDGLGHVLGYADSFGECKELHKAWLAADNHPNKDNYAGLSCEGYYLKNGMAFPAFYQEY